MRVIIGGAGRVGIELAKALRKEEFDVVLIESDSRTVSNAQGLDCLVIHGDITSRDKLIEAGVEKARVFVATTSSDEHNLIACSIAEHANKGAKQTLITVCRITKEHFVEEYKNNHMKEWANIDHIVNPLRGAIERLNAGLRSADIEEVISFDHGAYVLELEISESAHNIVNKPLGELKDELVHGLPTIVAIQRENQRGFVPQNDTKLQFGDHIAVATVGLESFNPVLIMFGHEMTYFPETPKVAVIGATDLGRRMATNWLEHGAHVTVIERELHLANELAGSSIGANPRLDVIHGDHLDRTVLTEIAIDTHHVAVGALGNDHENIAAVLLASDMGVKRTGLMLYDADLVSVTHRMGISFAVDRQRVAVDNILTHIHGKLAGHYALLGGISDIIGLTFEVTEKAKFAGKSILKAQFPEWMQIAFIQRQSLAGDWDTMDAKLDTVLHIHDRVILFCAREKIAEAEKRFKV